MYVGLYRGDGTVSHEKDYYIGLSDRCWKLLPIYEGIDTKGKKIFDDETAFRNFEKNLDCLLIEIKGSIANYGTNSYCEQVLNLLAGLKQEKNVDHSTVKSVAIRCFNLCRKASEA